jgi:hypothetical protein
MPRTDLFIKVAVETPDGERPERLAAEICRHIRKIYGVRSADLSHCVEQSEDTFTAETQRPQRNRGEVL